MAGSEIQSHPIRTKDMQINAGPVESVKAHDCFKVPFQSQHTSLWAIEFHLAYMTGYLNII